MNTASTETQSANTNLRGTSVQKKKLKIILKKKPSTSSGLIATKGNYFDFARELRLCHPNHTPGLIRKWYEDCFKEFPPWDKYGFLFCRARISYHLYYYELKEKGLPIAESVVQNYRATQEFKIDQMSNTILKGQILAELSQIKAGGNEMAREKDKVVAPVKAKKAAGGEKVHQSWVRILSENVTKKLSDTDVAKRMCEAHPEKKPYTAGDVARHRSIFNTGGFPTQEGKAPKVRLEQFGAEKSNGKAKVAKAAKPAPAPVAKKAEAKPKKKIVLKSGKK